MHIKSTDSRERIWEQLEEATGENTTSGALDIAARYYLAMRGGTHAQPTGALEELLSAAEEQGSLTAPEIAEILTTDELPVEVEVSRNIGRDSE